MRHDDRTAAASGDVCDEVVDQRNGRRVQARMRLVEQQEGGPGHEDARELDAPPHAVRAVGGPAVAGSGEADGVEHLGDLAGGVPGQSCGEQQVFLERQFVPQRRGVADEGDLMADLVPPVGAQVGTEDLAVTRRGLPQRREDSQEGGLAGAVGSHEPDRLAGVEGEVEAAQDRRLAAPHSDPNQRGDRHRRSVRAEGTSLPTSSVVHKLARISEECP